MTKCGFCGSSILMGGVRAGGQRFCNNKCHQNAVVLSAVKNIPADVLNKKVEEIWMGECPRCRGRGPVDVHKIHQVWSALLLTRWTTQPQVSCRSCATKRQLGGALFSLFFGWWGFPWGLILTPVQISRNIIGMSAGPNNSRPSDELRKMVLIGIGSQLSSNQPRG